MTTIKFNDILTDKRYHLEVTILLVAIRINSDILTTLKPFVKGVKAI